MSFHYVDTLSLPYNIGYTRSYYSLVEDTVLNTYYYLNDDGLAVFNYCIGSIFPYRQFQHKNYISDHFEESDSTFLIRFPRDSVFIRINNKGDIIDTLSLIMQEVGGEKFCMNSFLQHYYIPKENDSGILYCRAFLKSENSDDYNLRKSDYSRPIFKKFTVRKHLIKQTSDGIGKYPYTHFQKDTLRYNYHGTSTMNRNGDIVRTYNYVDSLYVIHLDGTQDRYFFRSKYQKHANEMFTTSPYDYVGIERHLMSQTTYGQVLFDPYREFYYVLVSRPIPFENEDGTRNKLSDKPCSLIVIDKDFKQIAEIDIPNQFDKAEVMIIPEGIAFIDCSLSGDNSNVFVICDIY